MPLYRILTSCWFYLLSKRLFLNVFFLKKFFFMTWFLKTRVKKLFLWPIAWTMYQSMWSCIISLLCGFNLLNKFLFWKSCRLRDKTIFLDFLNFKNEGTNLLLLWISYANYKNLWICRKHVLCLFNLLNKWFFLNVLVFKIFF